jgi:hypothetical protein
MLSTKELELVTNPNIILTKNAIIGKVYDLFGQLSEAYKTVLTNKELLAIGPKIARGENYQGLPWVMLDFPRKFTQSDTMAIRSFFWWGHFFSITLQLTGTSKDKLLPQLMASLETENWTGWYLGVGADEWRHDFEPDNYLPLTAANVHAIMQQGVIKLATKIPLQEWDDANLFFQENYKRLVGQLQLVG